MQVKANGINIEVEDTGSGGSQPGDAADGLHAKRPVVVLIMGLGMQLVAWPMQLVQALSDAGYRVVRHDNRDVGLSQQMDHLGTPNVVWESIKLKLGFLPRAPYSIHDMAHDTLGVMDALGIDRAHIVGASMGGMIAQRVAIEAPQRTLSLTSIMSTSGARGLPEASGKVIRALLGRPSGTGEEALVAHYIKLFKVIGSPGYPTPDDVMRERILLMVRRSTYRPGTLRQLVAIAADTGPRARDLARVASPALVLHGKADPLIPYPCGEDTARRIPGANMVGIPGMGHDLSAGVIDQLVPHLLAHFKAG
ncbi:MAG: alpha/beta fold hydrolase [Bdellovibrionales bacterium]|nr:alpha/beta fold hydrolase [Ramlibacter sp.]